jgi:hypothetical protein
MANLAPGRDSFFPGHPRLKSLRKLPHWTPLDRGIKDPWILWPECSLLARNTRFYDRTRHPRSSPTTSPQLSIKTFTMFGLCPTFDWYGFFPVNRSGYSAILLFSFSLLFHVPGHPLRSFTQK